MTKLKKSAKVILKYGWKIVLVVFFISYIVSTVEAIIDKNYDSVIDNTIIANSTVLILLQSKTIKNKDDIIQMQDDLIAKQSTKIAKETLTKQNTDRFSK
ncbi:hypothetical protein [Pediococcus pentosaceus]|uniref:hypothetical protein n=1 Tax=Pediococcus pentosaceus TaxID=1255 RepID=UPI002E36BECC|nr:hypothetical protein [Pediococcus pentosaceus]